MRDSPFIVGADTHGQNDTRPSNGLNNNDFDCKEIWGMGLSYPRFTVRQMMVVTAILAVAPCMFFGISQLALYAQYAHKEKCFRDGAAIWEMKKDAGKATSWRQMAEEAAQLERE